MTYQEPEVSGEPHYEPNQTLFAEEEPLYENPVVFAPPADPNAPKPKRFSPLVLVLVAVGVIITLLLILLVVFGRGNGGGTTPDDTPTPSPLSEANYTELERRVKELRAQQTAADPFKQNLPFPPVDMTIQLDPPKR